MRSNLEIDKIPNELKKIPQWVCWRSEGHDIGEALINPRDGSQASVNDPLTWGAFDDTINRIKEDDDLTGIGVILTPDSNIVGVTIENCYKDEKRIWAADLLIDHMQSYTEKSPSGQGITIFASGKLPRGPRINDCCKVSDSGQFIKVTGNVHPDFNRIEPRQDELDYLYQEVFLSPQVSMQIPSTDVDTNIQQDYRNGIDYNLPWPSPLSKEAYHGLVGQFIDKIYPHTESDPAALLLQALAAFGNIAGNEAHFLVESDKHPAKLNIVLCGETAKSRKGLSWGNVHRLMSEVDPTWVKFCVKSGLSSGEGLIHHVRDASGALDPGVADKRLFVLEAEFANVLRVARREGNILSTVMRDAWDKDFLSCLTRNLPLTSTGAHITINGHITIDEVRRELTQADKVSGFANRFLWVCVRRSKLLPNGGNLNWQIMNPIIQGLKDALTFAKTVGVIKRGAEAQKIWVDIYPYLSEGKSGLLGAVTSRSEAQVVRLSLIYALLDQAIEIRKEHLQAALAVWNYCEQSCHVIFGERIGHGPADTIFEAIKASPEGLSRTDISNLFNRHQDKASIDSAISILKNMGWIVEQSVDTDGRPITKYVYARN